MTLRWQLKEICLSSRNYALNLMLLLAAAIASAQVANGNLQIYHIAMGQGDVAVLISPEVKVVHGVSGRELEGALFDVERSEFGADGRAEAGAWIWSGGGSVSAVITLRNVVEAELVLPEFGCDEAQLGSECREEACVEGCDGASAASAG